MKIQSKLVFYITILLISFLKPSTGRMRNNADAWRHEATGESDDITPQDDQNYDAYKEALLEHVFKTNAPSQELLESDGETIPYVMDTLYSAVANRTTGEHRWREMDIDFIRGLEDHWAVQRRMEFWFNTTNVFNETEEVIQANFHIHKKRATSPNSGSSSHRVSVSLYRIVDKDTLFNDDGSVGPGGHLLERKQVSAYTAQWLVFKTSLKDTVKDWITNPSQNNGILITATDTHNNHVNGTHIDFVQRGENPTSHQPVFVVYTDRERKRNNKKKKNIRNEIDFVVDNFLNEERSQDQTVCTFRDGRNECAARVIRQRRSLSRSSSTDSSSADDYNDDWEGNSSRLRRGSQQTNPNVERYIEATRRSNSYCQKKDLYVRFQALRWDRWIVAPEGINAGYCNGSCPFPLSSTLSTTNHAILQSVSNYHKPDQVKAPCCVPKRLAPMSLLYYQTRKVVMMRNYDNMMVMNCGCR